MKFYAAVGLMLYTLVPSLTYAHTGHPEDGWWGQIVSLKHSEANILGIALLAVVVYSAVKKFRVPKKSAQEEISKSDK